MFNRNKKGGGRRFRHPLQQVVSCAAIAMNAPDPHKLMRVFSAQTTTELAEFYDDLAAEYDSHHMNETYLAPIHIMDIVCRHVAPEERILDAGCGTGLTGQVLAERGYHNLEGLDLSLGMLAQARQKSCYTQLYQQVLGEPLDLPSGAFDAVLGVGIFAKAHVPSSALTEFIRITRPGGHVIFNIRPEFYAASNFKDKLPELEHAGLWRLVEASEPLSILPEKAPHILMQAWVYQVV